VLLRSDLLVVVSKYYSIFLNCSPLRQFPVAQFVGALPYLNFYRFFVDFSCSSKPKKILYSLRVSLIYVSFTGGYVERLNYVYDRGLGCVNVSRT